MFIRVVVQQSKTKKIRFYNGKPTIRKFLLHIVTDFFIGTYLLCLALVNYYNYPEKSNGMPNDCQLTGRKCARHMPNHGIMQGWPTQIGLWAAFGQISKNIEFLGRFLTKTEEKHSKYRKIVDFQSKTGPQKILSGPRVGHPWYNEHRTRWKFT
jgi:hypothetical protein